MHVGVPNICLHVTHKQRRATAFFSKGDYDFATDCNGGDGKNSVDDGCGIENHRRKITLD